MLLDNPMVLIERRRGHVEEARAAQGGLLRVAYQFPFVGAGEDFRDVSFPVWFVEPPVVTFGGEVEAGTALVAGNYPWCSAMTAGWVTEVRGAATYYTGTRVVLVVGGSGTQRGSAHVIVEGKALKGPLT